MPPDSPESIALVLVGLIAGMAGGLLGIGGGVIVVPVLTLFMGRDQHLAQAAAMIVNVFVALPALVRHHHAGAVRWSVVWRILPPGILAICLGVVVSDRADPQVLRRIFGLFLVYVVVGNVARLSGARRQRDDVAPRTGWAAAGAVGGTSGFVAGLLGIGGGPIAVPLLRRVCYLPLRESVPVSSAVICLTSAVGAVLKNAGLPAIAGPDGVPLGLSSHESLVLAAWLAPTAMVGAFLGASLTHRVPVAALRVAFIVLLAWAGAEMLNFLGHTPASAPAIVDAQGSPGR
jgi:hypothetical protein